MEYRDLLPIIHPVEELAEKSTKAKDPANTHKLITDARIKALQEDVAEMKSGLAEMFDYIQKMESKACGPSCSCSA